MRIVRLAAPSGFTQVTNSALRDERLSYKARGIHANLLSNSDEGWVESADSLAEKSPDGRHAVRTGLQELVMHGYIEYRKSQGPDGKWSTEMIVYTSPKSGNLTPVPPAVSPMKAQVAPESGNQTPDRSQKTRTRSHQPKQEFPQVAPESGFPAVGKPDSVQKTITEYQQKTIKERGRGTHEPAAQPSAETPRPDGLSPIPDDFAPTDPMRRWAVATFGQRIDVNFETSQFVSHYRSTGARRKSWPDAWQKWIRDSDRRITERGPARATPNGRRRSTKDDAFTQHQELRAELFGPGKPPPTLVRGELT